jgi:small ligand-binding sensory domain FIST
MVVRDEAGIKADLQEKLLAYKRKDLQAMLTGQSLAPALGVLLFTDMERGNELYGAANVESQQVLDFVPAPLAGMFAAGEIGSTGGRTSLYEFTCVAGILRAGGGSMAGSSISISSSSSSSSSSGGEGGGESTAS